MDWQELTLILTRPIAFHKVFVDISGSVNAGLMLSQAFYWSARTKDPDGWFYKTQQEWEEETGMRRSEQEKARRALKSIGVLEELRCGIPAKLFFRVNKEKLISLLDGVIQPVSVEKVLEIYGSTLKELSKTGLMRAKKLGVKTEYVEYSEILKKHGMKCGICGEQIKLGIGKTKNNLSFDHKKPLFVGGEHVFDNIQPAHFSCNAAKAGKDIDTKQPQANSGD